MGVQFTSLGRIRPTTKQLKLICVTAPLVWMVMAMPVLARCTADLAFYNLNRRIHGEVNVECGGIHSAPYGNWGVNSNYGGREDGHQFPGWKPENSQLQWNSCTRLRPPNYYFQRGAVPPAQWANPDDSRVYAVARIRSPRGYSCESWLPGGVFTVLYPYMSLYELDPWSPDDWVANLGYPYINVPLTCTGPWNCTGWSDVVSPNRGNSIVTADIKVYVRLYRR